MKKKIIFEETEDEKGKQKKYQERIKNGEICILLNKYGIPSESESAWIANL